MAHRAALLISVVCAVVAMTAGAPASHDALAAGSPVVPSFAGCFGTAPQVRPASIVVACGDGNFFLTRLKWSSWNATAAAGLATGHQNDCKPYCAAGHFHLYLVSVHLSRPENCRNGRREFTRFTFRFVSSKPPHVARGGTFKSPFYRGNGCP